MIFTKEQERLAEAVKSKSLAILPAEKNQLFHLMEIAAQGLKAVQYPTATARILFHMDRILELTLRFNIFLL